MEGRMEGLIVDMEETMDGGMDKWNDEGRTERNGSDADKANHTCHQRPQTFPAGYRLNVQLHKYIQVP